jgi:hypothetical protein
MFLTTLLKRVAHSIARACKKFADRWWPRLVSSGKEVLFTLLVSNGALLFAVFIHYVDTPGEKPSIATALQVIFAEIKSTEVLAYVLAILAAPLWIMLSRWQARRHANFFFWLLIIQAIMVFGSGYIFARARTPGGIANQQFVSSWALYSFVGAVVIWFVTLMYQKLVLDGSNETMATPSSSGQSGEGVLDRLRGGQS